MSFHQATQTVVVAVDVGKNTLALSATDSEHQVLLDPFDAAMTRTGLNAALEKIQIVIPPDIPALVGIEAAGHYHRPLMSSVSWPPGVGPSPAESGPRGRTTPDPGPAPGEDRRDRSRSNHRTGPGRPGPTNDRTLRGHRIHHRAGRAPVSPHRGPEPASRKAISAPSIFMNSMTQTVLDFPVSANARRTSGR